MTALLFWVCLFLFSLLVLVVIIGRHRRALVALDIASIPRAQEKIIKKELVAARLFRTIQENALATMKKFGPVYTAWVKTQQGFRDLANFIADQYRALAWQKKWEEWRGRSRHERRAHLLGLLNEADELRHAEKIDEAEKKYVEVIGLDPRNVNAYVCLGKAYFRTGKWAEAEETLRHVVHKLDPEHERAWGFLGRTLKAAEKWAEAAVAFERAVALDDSMGKRWVDLGECYEAVASVDKARAAYEKAAQLEPHNPRTLDHLIEISIISGDKRLASWAFSQLQEVNPENQKLGEWMEKIREM